VRLPHPFEGGQLQVSHKGHSTLFDWSKSRPETADWAAFDIKCDYEVFDVTAGHRLTLIYDLYFTERVGGIFGNPPIVAPKQLPFYEITKRMLEQPGFMIHGKFNLDAFSELEIFSEPCQFLGRWKLISES
jgi:hypothetical protein